MISMSYALSASASWCCTRDASSSTARSICANEHRRAWCARCVSTCAAPSGHRDLVACAIFRAFQRNDGESHPNVLVTYVALVIGHALLSIVQRDLRGFYRAPTSMHGGMLLAAIGLA